MTIAIDVSSWGWPQWVENEGPASPASTGDGQRANTKGAPNITNEHPVEPATTSIPHKGRVFAR